METVLWTLICIFATAAIIDRTLSTNTVRKWQHATMGLRHKLSELDTAQATRAISSWCQSLFDAIYDERFWSLRRLFRSCLSSLLALSLIVLVLGWRRTQFGSIDANLLPGTELWLPLVLLLIPGNLVADYVSLQETRWVLGRSQAAGLLKLCGWGIVDLVATTLIFLIAWALTWRVWLYMSPEWRFSTWEYFASLMDLRDGLPFFLSTFFTSAFWFLFVFSAFLIRGLQRSSRVLRMVLQTIGESRAPARTTAGILVLVLVAGYGIAAAIGQLVG